MKRFAVLALACVMLACACGGCGAVPQKGAASSSSAVKETTLTIAGPWEESAALEAVSAGFEKANPGCRVVYEYVQNYYEAMPVRLGGDAPGVDIFVTKNIQPGSAFKDYALELLSQKDRLDLSGTFDGLIQNFRYLNGGGDGELYAVPLGAELRGMYVNKTLLARAGAAVPANRAELLSACEKLLGAGYVPLQGNPGNFGQWLMYPYICNMIANAPDYDAVYKKINGRGAGVSEFFRDPMELMYTLTAKGYYNYKAVESATGFFADGGAELSARNFLSISGKSGSYSKADDVGTAAFMPGVMSLGNTIAKIKDDYHSGIDYEFILSPTGADGGYAYMSPSDGVAVCVKSQNRDLALKYMNYLFSPEVNKLFAAKDDITPNTSDAFAEIKAKFSLPDDRISQLGSVTFDYAFYSVILETLTEISKANNPKYMKQNGDGTYSMYPFEYYMEKFEKRFHSS